MSEEEIEASTVAPTKSLFTAPVDDASTSEVAESTDEQPVSVEVKTVEEQLHEPEPTTATEENTAVEAPTVEPTEEDEVQVEEPVTSQTETEAVNVEEPVVTSTEPTLADLQKTEAKVQTEIAKKQASEKAAIINQIAAVVKTYSIPVGELVKALGGVPSTRKGTKAPITHKDTLGNQWTGRGRLPRWLKDKNPDDFRV